MLKLLHAVTICDLSQNPIVTLNLHYYYFLTQDEAWYLVKARRWNAAHRCVVKNVAPDAVADDDHEFLHVLLNELAAVSSEIDG